MSKNEISFDNLGIECTAVIYGDGSADNITGEYGAGATGYIYTDDAIDKKSGDVPSKYVITDIGYLENSELNKYKYKTVLPKFYFDGVYGYTDVGSNNRAEILSFIETIDNLLDDIRFNIKKVIFKSDSAYTLLAIEYIRDKSENEWKPKLISNIDIITKLQEIINRLKDNSVEIITMKVQGHSISLGNNIADRLAFMARRTKKRYFNIVENNKHWSKKIEPHPLVKFKQLFTNVYENKKENIYGIMEYKVGVEIGKKSHESIFGLVVLNDKLQLVEDAVTKYLSRFKTLNLVYSVNLENLYNRNSGYYYSLYGSDIMYVNRRTNNVLTIDDNVVVKNIYPSGLAVQAYDKMLKLYDILKIYRDYISNSKLDVNLYNIIDITDKIYTIGKKNKYSCIIPVTANSLDLDIEAFNKKLKIIVGYSRDTISRSQFKSLEKSSPKVYLILNAFYGNMIEYYTIVDLNDGNTGVYCNLYSNKVFDSTK